MIRLSYLQNGSDKRRWWPNGVKRDTRLDAYFGKARGSIGMSRGIVRHSVPNAFRLELQWNVGKARCDWTGDLLRFFPGMYVQ